MLAIAAAVGAPGAVATTVAGTNRVRQEQQQHHQQLMVPPRIMPRLGLTITQGSSAGEAAAGAKDIQQQQHQEQRHTLQATAAAWALLWHPATGLKQLQQLTAYMQVT